VAALKNKGHKNGKLLTSHRSTIYPCYLPVLGEFNRSWPYKTCRCKYRAELVRDKIRRKLILFFIQTTAPIG